jgi:hypothetical protein
MPSAFSHVPLMIEIRQGTEIGHVNSLALSRSGDTYESLAAVATAIASHRGGFRGINVMDFLLRLMIQLLPSSHHPVGVTKSTRLGICHPSFVVD